MHAYTAGAAHANFADRGRSSIQPGKLADLIVLSDNLHRIAPRRLLDTTVTHTLVGGVMLP